MDSIDGDVHISGSESSGSPGEDASHSPSQQQPSPPHQHQPTKRSASDAGLKAGGSRPAKNVKRRASKACQCCRARKVRCNVVEHGPPCTNCRLDEVECVVSESKRKKKWSTAGIDVSPPQPTTNGFRNTVKFAPSVQSYESNKSNDAHNHNPLYHDLDSDMGLPPTPGQARPALFPSIFMRMEGPSHEPSVTETLSSIPFLPNLFPPITPTYSLPLYVKPLPSKLAAEDILYLEKKGALAIPKTKLRNHLLQKYIEFVYPFMPMLDIHGLVNAIDRSDGTSPISLLLFQSIMFSAVAFADIDLLKEEGFVSRRDARRHFFMRPRLLYDFDIEVDRIALIQSLLLMTFWYETPDDQKDSHHWMGIAVSLSHTIGLHRSAENSSAMDVQRKKLWKRIWWSIYMRDRLVALGMRRPTRIKDSDYDVAPLSMDDFDLKVLSNTSSCVPPSCVYMRNLEVQEQLAIMCVEKTKLCVCMSHVLSAQYSVLNNNHGVVSEEGSTSTTVRLVAKKKDTGMNELQTCDKELRAWYNELPDQARYHRPSWNGFDVGRETISLNNSLLHMIYFATLSALHRPQVLPSATAPPRTTGPDLLEHSRQAVRLAATEITKIATGLYNMDLVRYLPTTGITMLLPAIIIHLLDIKAPEESTRRDSLRGFCQCMQVMARLRDIYAAADYSIAFLEAAIRKAEIIIPQKPDEIRKEDLHFITSAQGLVEAGRRLQLVTADSRALTPPPEQIDVKYEIRPQESHEDDLARQLNTYLATSPPDSEETGERLEALFSGMPQQGEYEPDFDSLINLDAAGDVWNLEDGAYAAMSGESGGFIDLEWLRGIKENDGIAA